MRVFGCLTEASCTNCRPTWDEELFELRFESLSREHKRGSLLNRSFSDSVTTKSSRNFKFSYLFRNACIRVVRVHCLSVDYNGDTIPT